MKTIAGVFETREAAEDAVQRLLAAGFRRDAIGVAMRDPRASGELAEATGADDLSAEGATAGAISGAGVGALIGLALVGSTLVLPGIGPILVGGSLATGAVTAAGTAAAALTGAGLGGLSGGLIGGLVGAGISEEEATGYVEQIQQGRILVAVNADEATAPQAREILVQQGARLS
jgi:hypothetical protein